MEFPVSEVMIKPLLMQWMMEVPSAKSFLYGLNVALDDKLNIVSLRFEFTTKGTSDMMYKDKI